MLPPTPVIIRKSHPPSLRIPRLVAAGTRRLPFVDVGEDITHFIVCACLSSQRRAQDYVS